MIPLIRSKYELYKELAEKAIAQVKKKDLAVALGPEQNSIAILVWHLSGNLSSRFTDFLDSDGEKPWRHRDEEFEERRVGRKELLSKWEEGFGVLFAALDSLEASDLERTVTIRGKELTVCEALLRSLTHLAYHVGQIVQLARHLAGEDWESLSIPRGGSAEYNQNPTLG